MKTPVCLVGLMLSIGLLACDKSAKAKFQIANRTSVIVDSLSIEPNTDEAQGVKKFHPVFRLGKSRRLQKRQPVVDEEVCKCGT